MVGREREFAALQLAWRAAGRMVLVRGSAGIGKSRLVRELAERVRAAGGTVLAGRCSPTAADVPFRPLREALLAAARTGLRPSAEVAPFLPSLGSLVPEWVAARDASLDGGAIVLAEGLLRLMVAWSSPEVPALLVIEDMQWSDRETINAVEYLADNLAGHPALVIVTLRGGEPGPGADLMEALHVRRAIQPVDLFPLEPAQSEVNGARYALPCRRRWKLFIQASRVAPASWPPASPSRRACASVPLTCGSRRPAAR